MTSGDGFTSIGCFHCNPFWGVMVQGTNELDTIDVWNTRVERTCHNKARYGNFKCDVCNAFLQLSDFDEEPMLTINGVGYVPDYCPHCGAKVEDE